MPKVQLLSVWCPAGYSCWGKPPAEEQPKANFLVLLTLAVSSYLPKGLSCHGIKPAALCQLWPHGNSGFGGAHASSLQVETNLRVYSGMPHAMLGES
jgi:hypothetical protein